MKKILKAIVCLTLVVVFMLCGCQNKEPLVIKETDTKIIIYASGSEREIKNDTTLLDYMKYLKDKGELEYSINGGMVTSINGISNTANYSSCWMLYTDDELSANIGWGSVDYKGKLYGSAIAGAESLIIKDGCTYIWVYQTF